MNSSLAFSIAPELLNTLFSYEGKSDVSDFFFSIALLSRIPYLSMGSFDNPLGALYPSPSTRDTSFLS